MARGAHLKDNRIGFVLSASFCPLGSEVAPIVARAVDAIRRQGVRMDEGWPKGIDFPKLFEDCFFLVVNGAYRATDELAKRIGDLKGWDTTTPSLRARPALPRITSGGRATVCGPKVRAIVTNDGKRAYSDLLRWMTMPVLAGCPTTVAPAGRMPGGLLVGIQIMGPIWTTPRPTISQGSWST